MVGSVKKLLFGFGKMLLVLGLALGAYLAYGMYAESSASKRAAVMCASITVGSDASTLRDRAIADGASDFQTRWTKSDGRETLLITYLGLPPFSRHTCTVTVDSGRVVAAAQGYLD